MKIDRLELLGLLKTLSPAIAGTKNQVQELSCIWFSGDKVSAFDDVLGIEIAFPTEFTGGIFGEKLLGVVERSRAKEVTIEVEGEAALLKIGAARIKLACRPIDDWFWKPEVPEKTGCVLTKEFREAVAMSLISVGAASVLNPEQRGVTIIQNGEAADLYTTDAVSLSWIRLNTKGKPIAAAGSRVILPTPFCEQVKSLKRPAELRFDENGVYCLTDIDPAEIGGRKAEKDEDRKFYDVTIFSKLVEDDNPVPFEDVVKEHVSGHDGVEIPKQLKLRAERAMVLLSDQPVDFEIEKNQLYLLAATPYGEVDDVLKIGDHPDIAIKLDIRLLHRALDGREKMHVAKNGVTLTGPGAFTHIIATK